tara:strand:- start:9 stop:482 length:474 start_codon:yes stop_codon:yes gene_type:complete
MNVAGADQILISKYSFDKDSTELLAFKKKKLNADMGVCNAIRTNPLAMLTIKTRTRIAILSDFSRAPIDCAVRLVVPILRKPNPQYNKENSIALIATAPISDGSGICPTIAVSITPIRGVEMLEIITGIAKAKTLLLVFNLSDAIPSVVEGLQKFDR